LVGYQVEPPPPGFATWEDFARDHGIPEDQWDGWGALIDPEGVHLDVNVGGELEGDERTARVKEEAGRIEALGATRQREASERGEFWIVMQDPEGNEFCLQ
jgi:hypothetical protein